ncbi:MAG: hypothetical protein IPJ71_15540 [Bdellovibrionales bacterium]|nr:hypothetical protein [Bdellovibrionales bacterium]
MGLEVAGYREPQLTLNSHFRFGYDNKSEAFRTNPEQAWWVKYGRCRRQPHPFRDECVATARAIRAKASGDIWILFSGGVDSETVLRSFLEAGISVRIAVARFKDQINLHDISWAVLTCNELGVPFHFFDLDLLKFWRNEALSYAEISQCFSPQLLVTMWLSDQVSGYPVLGSGECLFRKEPTAPDDSAGKSQDQDRNENRWFLIEKERIASWYRFFIARNREACPGFFQYTPEIMLSYLRDPLVHRLVNDHLGDIQSSEEVKLSIYQQHFDLKTRPKYTGFEKVQEEDARLRSFLKLRYSHSDQIVRTRCTDLEGILAP